MLIARGVCEKILWCSSARNKRREIDKTLIAMCVDVNRSRKREIRTTRENREGHHQKSTFDDEKSREADTGVCRTQNVHNTHGLLVADYVIVDSVVRVTFVVGVCIRVVPTCDNCYVHNT